MSSQPVNAEAIIVENGARPRRRWIKPVAWVAGVVIVLVVAFFITDAAIRSSAEGKVRETIAEKLPAGITAKGLKVDIGGFSVIGQYLSGSFDRVTVDASEVDVHGTPLTVRLVASGIPVDTSKPVRDIRGTVSIDQASVNKLIQIPGSTSSLTLGKGTVGYTGSASFLGLDISYTAIATPMMRGNTLLLTPKSATAKVGGVSVDASKLLGDALGNKPLPYCVASYLPKGVEVRALTISPGKATVKIAARNVVLSAATFDSHGSCAS